MIKKHNSIARADNIINSFISSTYSKDYLDGIVEIFKNKDIQGYVMKLYKTFDPYEDLCVWVYENLDKKTINTIIGKHINCDKDNLWCGEDLKFNEYPVVINIKKQIVNDMSDYIYDFYSKSFKI